MELVYPTAEAAPPQLAALAGIAEAANGGIGRPEARLLSALEDRVYRDAGAGAASSPVGFDGASIDPAEARQLVRFGVVVALASGPPTPAQHAALDALAQRLDVSEPAVAALRHLAAGSVGRFRLAFLRHSHIRAYLKNTRALVGGLGALRAGLIFRGILPEDRRSSARFRALASLPEESLGRRFFEHCRRAELPFPGERGGFPAGAIFHDFTHVLAGYDTSPEGEMQAAAFQAGFTQGPHDFFTWLFSVVIHTAGVNLAPFPMPVKLGRIGDGRLADAVIEALARGNAVNRDLGNGWDFWEWVELPIDAARERLGVPPLRQAA